jgi:HEAT repeat protein
MEDPLVLTEQPEEAEQFDEAERFEDEDAEAPDGEQGAAEAAQGPPPAEEGQAEGEGVEEPEREPERKPSVFISHKRAPLDNDISTRLAADLAPLCEEIYLDLEMKPGDPYEQIIKEKVSKADFVIALISEHANESDWVKVELQYADHYNRAQGRPVIIPVRLGFTGLYDPLVAVYLDRFNRIDWNPAEPHTYQSELLEPLQLTIGNIHRERQRLPEYGMEGFLVHDSRRERFRAAFVEPPAVGEAREMLRSSRLLWVKGEAGVRNYVALSLAAAEPNEKIYEISKPRSWSDIDKTLVSGATIIFQDVVPATHFEESTAKTELDSLRRLVRRGNTVLVTMSEDAFADVEQEIRKEDFEYDDCAAVGPDTYGDEDKREIFGRLLEHVYDADLIPHDQYRWARALLGEPAPAAGRPVERERARAQARDKFFEIIRKCTPADIERFFTLQLRQAARPGDILKLLQSNVAGDEEIHAWFVSLDDSTRCFVMTLALFSELSREELWGKHKSVVQALQKLDPSLSLLPLGIYRQRAIPYVSADGPIRFVNARVAEAIHDEIAKNYREYFVELLPKLREWSVPQRRAQGATRPTDEERKRRADATREVRTSIAQMVGKVGKQGLDDLAGLLEYWASDPIFKVREAAAVALEQTARDSTAATYALDLLKEWCYGFGSDDQTLMRVYASASPLSRIATANQGRTVYPRALGYLKWLTKDTRRNRSVRFYASIALKRIARRVPLADTSPLLRRAAQDENPSTRINVAQALNEARFRDEPAALGLLADWSSSEDANLRWVAACSVLLWRRQPRGQDELEFQTKLQEVREHLARDPETVAGVLLEMLGDEHHKKSAWRVLEQVILLEGDGAREALLSGLAGLRFSQLEKRLLPRLRSSGEPQLENVVVEVRREFWRRRLTSPARFLNDLRARLGEERKAHEVFRALTGLLEPEESRQEFVSALTAFYPQDRGRLEEVLSRLKDMAPSVFAPVCLEVRREALKRLFYDPHAFVRIAAEDLRREGVRDEARAALESLAEPGPAGYRDELLQVLAYGFESDPASLRPLLGLLRGAGGRALARLTYDFTRRLLEGKLERPAVMVSVILGAADDPQEWDAMLGVLQQMAVPGPQGMRRELVSALAEARATDQAVTDQLLQHPSLRERHGLSRLQFEVKVTSLLESFYVPRIISRFFTPK